MCWVWSGPQLGQYLADLGAEVIKVEWYDRYDLYRTRGVERLREQVSEETRREMSFSFHSLNRGKLGMTANLKSDQGRATLKEVLQQSDLLIENFSAGTLDRLGLSAAVLGELNQRLVVLSLSASGKGSGVEALRAYGLVLSALGGAESTLVDTSGNFVGSPSFVISDPNAAVFGQYAAAAGLLHALRTGTGSIIECSQIEAIVSLLHASRSDTAPSQMRHEVVTARDGGFVAVSVAPGSDLDARSGLAAWAAELDVETIISQVQTGGGYAARVLDLNETEDAPEYAGSDVRLPTLHPVTGAETVVAAPWRAEGRRPVVRKPAPVLGESNDYVLRQVLGKSDREVADLRDATAI
jgi:crotonobetainyl-CoA:carnitine CoA-transferase CaiB-like acyl-CoA transferase